MNCCVYIVPACQLAAREGPPDSGPGLLCGSPRPPFRYSVSDAIFVKKMSNYDANPVGLLYERYQSSGVSPLYNVTQKTGQAHAPIFEVRVGFPSDHDVQ